MATPREESFRIAGEELTVTRRGAQRRVRAFQRAVARGLRRQPARRALGRCRNSSGSTFAWRSPAAQADWQLELTPVDAEIARYVERIVVSGRDGQVAKIEVRETGGDRSVLTTNPP